MAEALPTNQEDSSLEWAVNYPELSEEQVINKPESSKEQVVNCSKSSEEQVDNCPKSTDEQAVNCPEKSLMSSIVEMILLQESRAEDGVKSKHMVKNIVIFCSIHPDQQLVWNCIPCNEAVCPLCLYEDHNGHSAESIEHALKKIRPNVREALCEISEKVEDRQSVIETVEKKITDINKNKSNIMNELKEHREKVLNKLTDLINKEYQNLVTTLTETTAAQLKEMTLFKEDLEMSVTSDQCVNTWTNTLLDKTDGAGLLGELQSGLMDRINQIKTQPEKEMSENTSKMLEFEPSRLNYKHSLLGKVKLKATGHGGRDIQGKPTQFRTEAVSGKDNSIDLLVTEDSPNDCNADKNATSYRFSNTLLSNFQCKQITKLKSFHVEQSLYNPWRFCVFDNQLWIPLQNENIIKVLSLDNNSVQKTIEFHDVKRPWSIHPVKSNQLVLAAGSGLYLLASDGKVIDKLQGGYFRDVHVDKHLLAALANNEKKVYLWDVSGDQWQISSSFNVNVHKINYNTVHVREPHIYIGDTHGDNIHKYSLTGEHLAQYGPSTGTHLCMSDPNGNLMVTNYGRSNLVVLSDTGQPLYTVEVDGKPSDAVIVDDMLYIVHFNCITVYKIQN